jgi:hypothetical protein
MIDLAGAVADVVDVLRAAGIRATGDRRNLNPPAVYVPPPVIAWRFGKGTADLTWTIAAVVPNTGRVEALDNLSPLVDAVVAALPAITEGRPIDLTGIDQGGPLPCYELTMTTRTNTTRKVAP